MSGDIQNEHWFVTWWRPMAAYVYLVICICDFIIMPVYYEYANHKMKMVQQVEMALRFPEGVQQVEALRIIKETRVWEPITLQSSGLLHMAFGAILGVAAWSRGKEKVEEYKYSTEVRRTSAKPQPTYGYVSQQRMDTRAQPVNPDEPS